MRSSLEKNRAQEKRCFFELKFSFRRDYGSGKIAESGSGADMPDETSLITYRAGISRKIIEFCWRLRAGTNQRGRRPLLFRATARRAVLLAPYLSTHVESQSISVGSSVHEIISVLLLTTIQAFHRLT
jgi:hypothetical protein